MKKLLFTLGLLIGINGGNSFAQAIRNNVVDRVASEISAEVLQTLNSDRAVVLEGGAQEALKFNWFSLGRAVNQRQGFIHSIQEFQTLLRRAIQIGNMRPVGKPPYTTFFVEGFSGQENQRLQQSHRDVSAAFKLLPLHWLETLISDRYRVSKGESISYEHTSLYGLETQDIVDVEILYKELIALQKLYETEVALLTGEELSSKDFLRIEKVVQIELIEKIVAKIISEKLTKNETKRLFNDLAKGENGFGTFIEEIKLRLEYEFRGLDMNIWFMDEVRSTLNLIIEATNLNLDPFEIDTRFHERSRMIDQIHRAEIVDGDRFARERLLKVQEICRGLKW